MDNQIYMDIQKLIYYMIPEKWKYIKLYMSVIENPNSNKRGELFFYYMPKSLLRNTYVNCYEIPDMFDIDQDEYLNLISKLYNKISILNDIYNQNQMYWTNVTIIIEGSICKLEYYNQNLENSDFDSYERHIIWREKYLRMRPETKEEKQILKRYLMSNESKIKPYVEVVPGLKQKIKNIVEYEKVLTIDEALARGSSGLFEDDNIFVGKAKVPSSENKKNVVRATNNYIKINDRKNNIVKNNRNNNTSNNIKNNNKKKVKTNYDGQIVIDSSNYNEYIKTRKLDSIGYENVGSTDVNMFEDEYYNNGDINSTNYINNGNNTSNNIQYEQDLMQYNAVEQSTDDIDLFLENNGIYNNNDF